MIKLAVIADDITGANDTAVQFAKRNISSCVMIDFNHQTGWKERAEVIVLDTDSRDIAPEEAYQKVKEVCESLKANGVKNIYKKVDSTLRGNLGAEVEAAATVYQPELVVIAPAFPANHRVTVGGYHLLHHIPIELTEIAHAPKSPVNESRIVELLRRQTKYKIGLIPLAVVIAGAESVRAEIQKCMERGESWIVFDAVLDEHLQNIAVAAQHFQKILWVGSAGLAEQLPDFYQWSAGLAKESEKKQGTVLVVAGSVSKTTQNQVKALLEYSQMQLIKVHGGNVVTGPEMEVLRCIKQARAAIEQGKDIVIASAVQDQDVADAVAAGKQCGLTGTEVSEKTAAALGMIVAALTDYPLAGMVLTGGDTAIHVCRELGAQAIEILQEIATGIPLGRLVGGSCDGIQVVTKAGAFGADESLAIAVQAMRTEATGQQMPRCHYKGES